MFLSIARKLGASGAGTNLCSSSMPLEVQTKMTSPAPVIEQLLMLCGDTPSSFIMSTTQMTSASCFMSVGIGLPVALLRASTWALTSACSLWYSPSFSPSRKPFDVEAAHFAAVGDEPQPIALAVGHRADALVRPVVHAARRQLGAGVLPQKLAVLDVEAQQAAEIDVGRIPLEIRGRVVAAHEHLAVVHARRCRRIGSRASETHLMFLALAGFQAPVW